MNYSKIIDKARYFIDSYLLDAIGDKGSGNTGQVDAPVHAQVNPGTARRPRSGTVRKRFRRRIGERLRRYRTAYHHRVSPLLSSFS